MSPLETSTISTWTLFWQQSARWTVRHAGWIFAAFLSLAMMALVVAVTGLKLNPRSEGTFQSAFDFERNWQAYQAEFGEQQDTVIVLRGADAMRLTEAVTQLEAALRSPGRPFAQVLAFRDLTPWRTQAMHSVPLATLQAGEQWLQRRVTLVNKFDRFEQYRAAFLEALAKPGTADERATRLADWNLWLSEQAQEIDENATNNIAESTVLNELYDSIASFSRQPFLSADQREAYVYVKLNPAKDEFLPGAEALNALQRVVQEVEREHPQIKMEITGEVPRGLESQRQVLFVLMKCAGLCILGTCLLLGIGFGHWRQASAVLITLLISVSIWTGFVTLAIGEVSAFTLLGAFGLWPVMLASAAYYLAKYLEQRAQGSTVSAAIEAAAAACGPSLALICLTIAVAILFAGRGSGYGPLRDLGLLLSGGMLVGFLTISFALPAAIGWLERNQEATADCPSLQLSAVVWLPSRWPLFTLFLAALAICAILPGISKLRYNFFSTESHAAAFILCDTLEQRDELRRELHSSEQIVVSDEYSLPSIEDDSAKRRIIVKLSTSLEQLSLAKNPSLANRLAILEDDARQLFASGRVRNAPEELVGRVQHVFRQWERELSLAGDGNALPQWISLLPFMNPDAPRVSELSPELVLRTMGRNGKWLVRVQPREMISARAAWHSFVLEVERIAPQATGPAIRQWHLGKRTQAAYLQAAIYSVLTIAIVQLLVQQSIARTCLSVLPAMVGVLGMFGLAGWCDVSLSPLSCLAWPVVLAMGMSGGLFAGENSRSNALTLGMTLATGLILMVSVPCLIAVHDDLPNMGRLLMFGTLGSLCATLWIVPALFPAPQTQSSQTNELASPHFTPVVSTEPEVLLRVETVETESNQTLIRPHRRLVQPTRVNALRVPRSSGVKEVQS